MTDSNDLLDLVSEGRKATREKHIKKAAEKTTRPETTRRPGDPPIRRDIYQQLDWQPLSLTLVVARTECQTCASSAEAANPYILLERYHRRHGRHLVELTSFNLLPQEQMLCLPRRIEYRILSTPYCQHCFLKEKEICLTQHLQSLPSASSSSAIPCTPQSLAIPSLPKLWSDTFGNTWGTMKQSAEGYGMSNPPLSNFPTQE